MEQFIEKQIKNSDSFKANLVRKRIQKKLAKRERDKDEVIINQLLGANDSK